MTEELTDLVEGSPPDDPEHEVVEFGVGETVGAAHVLPGELGQVESAEGEPDDPAEEDKVDSVPGFGELPADREEGQSEEEDQDSEKGVVHRPGEGQCRKIKLHEEFFELEIVGKGGEVGLADLEGGVSGSGAGRGVTSGLGGDGPQPLSLQNGLDQTRLEESEEDFDGGDEEGEEEGFVQVVPELIRKPGFHWPALRS